MSGFSELVVNRINTEFSGVWNNDKGPLRRFQWMGRSKPAEVCDTGT